jgi:hypothetical protein
MAGAGRLLNVTHLRLEASVWVSREGLYLLGSAMRDGGLPALEQLTVSEGVCEDLAGLTQALAAGACARLRGIDLAGLVQDGQSESAAQGHLLVAAFRVWCSAAVTAELLYTIPSHLVCIISWPSTITLVACLPGEVWWFSWCLGWRIEHSGGDISLTVLVLTDSLAPLRRTRRSIIMYEALACSNVETFLRKIRTVVERQDRLRTAHAFTFYKRDPVFGVCIFFHRRGRVTRALRVLPADEPAPAWGSLP